MKRKGFSLALTLWIVAMMSLASVLYLTYAKKVVTKSRELRTQLELTFQTESMVELFKFYGSTGVIDSNYISNVHTHKYYPSLPKSFFMDSRDIVWKNCIITLQDTAGLIDMRDIGGLSSYIQNHSHILKDKKDIIKASLNDWLDVDSYVSLNGAENSFYQKSGYTSRSGAYWATKEELLLLRSIKDLNKSVQNELLSNLVITNKNKRNITTLSNKLLQSIYNLSNSDLEQLIILKKEGNINGFMTLFSTMYKENYDFERDGGSPSKIVKVKVICSRESIRKEINLLINFIALGQKNFEILNYED